MTVNWIHSQKNRRHVWTSKDKIYILTSNYHIVYIRYLFYKSLPGSVTSWETFSNITHYAISCRSNRPKSQKRPKLSKLNKMTTNLIFDSFNHSKMQFCTFWMIFHELLPLWNVKKHFVLSQYAISSRSNNENSRKWPKPSFLALMIIQKCISVMFEGSFMTW